MVIPVQGHESSREAYLQQLQELHGDDVNKAGTLAEAKQVVIKAMSKDSLGEKADKVINAKSLQELAWIAAQRRTGSGGTKSLKTLAEYLNKHKDHFKSELGQDVQGRIQQRGLRHLAEHGKYSVPNERMHKELEQVFAEKNGSLVHEILENKARIFEQYRDITKTGSSMEEAIALESFLSSLSPENSKSTKASIENFPIFFAALKKIKKDIVGFDKLPDETRMAALISDMKIQSGINKIDIEDGKKILAKSSLIPGNQKMESQRKIPTTFPRITQSDIQKLGLLPKHSIPCSECPNKEPILVSKPFQFGRYVATVAYIKDPNTDSYEIHAFYRSGSRGDWQSASHYAYDGNPTWIGKGAGGGKSSTVLPLETQQAMQSVLRHDTIENFEKFSGPNNPFKKDETAIKYIEAEIKKIENEIKNLEQQIEFESKNQGIDPKLHRKNAKLENKKTDLKDKQCINKQSEDIGSNVFYGILPYKSNKSFGSHFAILDEDSKKLNNILKNKADLMPDFSKLKNTFKINMSGYYSDDCTAYIFESKKQSQVQLKTQDGNDLDQQVNLRYMFVRDNVKGVAFLAAVQNMAAETNNFGVPIQSFDLEALGSGLVEYRDDKYKKIIENGVEKNVLKKGMMYHELDNYQGENISGTGYREVTKKYHTEDIPILKEANDAINKLHQNP